MDLFQTPLFLIKFNYPIFTQECGIVKSCVILSLLMHVCSHGTLYLLS